MATTSRGRRRGAAAQVQASTSGAGAATRGPRRGRRSDRSARLSEIVSKYVSDLVAAINQHRITGGIGRRDVLPGVDFDFFAGGMFGASERFASTTASVASYWVGAGLTWRFGRGACERLPVADEWGCTCGE